MKKMFEVKNHKTIISGLHEIVANEISLLNDGNNDIIYTGTNKFGNRLLGVIVFEDRINKFLRFFHILITEEAYLAFLNRKKTLRAILEESESFFIVDKNFEDKILGSNLVSIEDVPEKYLPLQNSFCPSFVNDASLDYTFSLKGGLSDAHQAYPEVMSSLNNTICTVLKNSSAFAREFGVIPMVFSKPAMVGSFELKFKINFQQPAQGSLFYKSLEDVNNFLSNFLKYIFGKLPNEKVDFLKADKIDSEEFIKIKEELTKLHEDRNITVPEEAKEQKIIDLITYSVDNFKDLEYKGFDRIEVMNKGANGADLPIALIENNFYETIEDKIFKPEELNKSAIITYDDKPTKYSVQFYQINKETGNGGAYFIGLNGGIIKISIHLRGRKNYSNTIYTKNVNEDTAIQVEGIGKKVDGILKEISIKLE